MKLKKIVRAIERVSSCCERNEVKIYFKNTEIKLHAAKAVDNFGGDCVVINLPNTCITVYAGEVQHLADILMILICNGIVFVGKPAHKFYLNKD